MYTDMALKEEDYEEEEETQSIEFRICKNIKLSYIMDSSLYLMQSY